MKYFFKNFYLLFILVIITSPLLKAEEQTAEKEFVNLRWGKIENAVTYILQVSKDKDFSDILFKKEVKDPIYKWERPPVGKFYFRLAVTDKYGQQSDFSKPGEINILPKAENKPVVAPPPPAPATEAKKEEPKGKEARRINVLLGLGMGYLSDSVIQTATAESANFLALNEKQGKFGSILLTAEYWPLKDSHWFNVAFDWAYSSIAGNFVNKTGKLSVNRIGVEGLVRYAFKSFSLYAGAGYRRMPVFFVKTDGSTFREGRNYFTESVYIKIQPASWRMMFKTGLLLSIFPSNMMLMPVVEAHYLFNRWRAGIRFNYISASVPVDIINTEDQSVIISGTDKNRTLALYMVIGIGI